MRRRRRKKRRTEANKGKQPFCVSMGAGSQEKGNEAELSELFQQSKGKRMYAT